MKNLHKYEEQNSSELYNISGEEDHIAKIAREKPKGEVGTLVDNAEGEGPLTLLQVVFGGKVGVLVLHHECPLTTI